MTDEQRRSFTADQWERRLERMWAIVVCVLAFWFAYMLLLPMASLLGMPEAVMAQYGTYSQEVTTLTISTVVSWIGGAAIAASRK